jgi:hypothetical protein
MVVYVVGEVSRVAVHEERIASLGVDPHPPPCSAVAFPSLESFHPRRSNHKAHQDRLTRREASHFIVAIAIEEDGSKTKKRRGWRKRLKTPCSPRLPFIAHTMRC